MSDSVARQQLNMEDPDQEKTSKEGVPEVPKKEVDPVLAEINKKIEEAFDIFDHEHNKTVDVRELGTIIRSLGCYPTESELHDMIQEVEEEEPTGFVCFEKFQPMMTKVLTERRYQPSSEEQLLKAFQVLDVDKNSHITPEELKSYFLEQGEVFQQEEMDEMLQAAIDGDKGVILYKEYVQQMLPQPEETR